MTLFLLSTLRELALSKAFWESRKQIANLGALQLSLKRLSFFTLSLEQKTVPTFLELLEIKCSRSRKARQ